ncbi:MAG: carbohydrate porin [Sedimenticolaceae bacterium]
MIALKAGAVTGTASAALLLCSVTCHVAAAGDASTPAAGVEITDMDSHASFGGPNSVASQIRSDEKPKSPVFDRDETPSTFQSYDDFKARLREEYGLTIGMDYNMLFQHASESPGEENAAGGVFRFFGRWTVLGEETGTPASIEFKVENRHRLGTDIAPSALAGEIGYAGLTAVPFSDAGWLLTNLYWHQSLDENRLAYIVGIVDVTDYVDVYGLVNPWTDFSNLAFSNDPTIPAPDQGLGAALRWSVDDHYYVLAGLADANGDPSDPWDSVDTFFNDGEYFKHIEAGWHGSWDARLDDNIHLTLWQADERTQADIPDGWGVAFSFSKRINERWLPFLRIGYADGSGAVLERSVSTGFAHYTPDKQGVFGLGLNWGRPNQDAFGMDARDQYTVEAYYRLQIADHLTITPDIQLIKDPATNPDDDCLWVAGLRARLSF